MAIPRHIHTGNAFAVWKRRYFLPCSALMCIAMSLIRLPACSTAGQRPFTLLRLLLLLPCEISLLPKKIFFLWMSDPRLPILALFATVFFLRPYLSPAAKILSTEALRKILKHSLKKPAHALNFTEAAQV